MAVFNKLNGRLVGTAKGWEIFWEKSWVGYECWPDTEDPRGAKGK